MSFISKTTSVGGSIMLTIPKEVVRMLNLNPNEQIEVEVKKIKKSGFGLFRGVGKFTKEDELQLND